MTHTIVVGAQWGDEGKGKIVDLLGQEVEYIVRFQGGNNAGHTLVVNGQKTVLHLIPSGVLHPGKICVIANGVVFNPEVFFREVTQLRHAGALDATPWSRIRVSDRAHVILPYHQHLDLLREKRASEKASQIGTTGRGIGPAYEDKVARRGIQVGDLLKESVLEQKLRLALEEKNLLFSGLYQAETFDLEPLLRACKDLGEQLRPYITDARVLLQEAQSQGRRILFEGAQGTLLDIDHGTYPFVTSSNTVAAGALTGSGLGFSSGVRVLGISKAYTTRVGSGPFPTEMETTEPDLAQHLRKKGGEFGATTGRARRIGWLDLVALRFAVQVNGLQALALTKADVLGGLDFVKVCTHYELGGNSIYEWPAHAEDLERAVPRFEVLPGWPDLTPGQLHSWAELPQELRSYVAYLEQQLGIPVEILSTGPGREEAIRR